MAEPTLETVAAKFPHWSHQSKVLLRLWEHTSPPVFIPGPQDDNKISFIREILESQQIRVAFCRISECYWHRNLFYETILQQLSMAFDDDDSPELWANITRGLAMLPPQKSGFRNVENCSSLDTFVERLKEILPPRHLSDPLTKRPIILLEGIDRLDRKIFGDHIIASLMRLEEMTQREIGLIMTSSGDWTDVMPEYPCANPLIFHLPAPSKQHLIDILKSGRISLPSAQQERINRLQTKPANPSASDLLDVRHYFGQFVATAVNALRLAFPKEHELRYIITILFPRYLEPVLASLEANTPVPGTAKLYSQIVPLFSVVIACPSLMLLKEELERRDASVAASLSTPTLDFPLICKYLLISGWLAATNPEIDKETVDRRRRRKSKQSDAARLEQESFAPPRHWRLDKLLSILDHLLSGNEEEEEAKKDENQDAVLSQDIGNKRKKTADEPPPKKFGKKADLNHSTSENAMDVDMDREFGPEDLNDSTIADASKPINTASMLPLLWQEKRGNAGQAEILTQIGVLEQVGLFIRQSAATSKTTRTRSEYKCGYDLIFVNSLANSINFPLWGFL